MYSCLIFNLYFYKRINSHTVLQDRVRSLLHVPLLALQSVLLQERIKEALQATRSEASTMVHGLDYEESMVKNTIAALEQLQVRLCRRLASYLRSCKGDGSRLHSIQKCEMFKLRD